MLVAAMSHLWHKWLKILVVQILLAGYCISPSLLTYLTRRLGGTGRCAEL